MGDVVQSICRGVVDEAPGRRSGRVDGRELESLGADGD
jgi:hypothetical protein